MCYTNSEICFSCGTVVKDTVPCIDYNIDRPYRHTRTGREEDNVSINAVRFYLCTGDYCQRKYGMFDAATLEWKVKDHVMRWDFTIRMYGWDEVRFIKALTKIVRHLCDDKEANVEVKRDARGNLIWWRP